MLQKQKIRRYEGDLANDMHAVPLTLFLLFIIAILCFFSLHFIVHTNQISSYNSHHFPDTRHLPIRTSPWNTDSFIKQNLTIGCNISTCRDNIPPRIFLNSQSARRNLYFPVLLYSFPGSGNTWCRLLIEWSIGIFTGSMYDDQSLINILPGESHCDLNVSAIKGIIST